MPEERAAGAQGIEEYGDVRIRRAAEDDYEAVLEVWLSAAHWICDSLGIKQWNPADFHLERVRRHASETELFVAEREGRVAGVYSVQWEDPNVWEGPDSGESGYIHKLAVHRSYGRKGMGSLLLRAAEAHIRSRGRRFARLDCVSGNDALNRYYAGHGYMYRGRKDHALYSVHLYEKEL